MASAQEVLEARCRSGAVGRQPLNRQQGRSQVAQPAEQPVERRLVDQGAGQCGRAVRLLGDGQTIEPDRPGRVEVAADADAVVRGRPIQCIHATLVLRPWLPSQRRCGRARAMTHQLGQPCPPVECGVVVGRAVGRRVQRQCEEQFRRAADVLHHVAQADHFRGAVADAVDAEQLAVVGAEDMMLLLEIV